MPNLTPAEAAQLLGISRQRVMTLLESGRIPGAFSNGTGERRYWTIPSEALADIKPKKTGPKLFGKWRKP